MEQSTLTLIDDLMRSRLSLTLFMVLAAALPAQTPYSSTSIGRPTRVEDAVVLDRYALDAFLSPVAFRQDKAFTGWSIEPGVAYGLIPRTQVELSVPVAFRGGNRTGEGGATGISLSAMYAFNVESRSLPAFALRGTSVIPVGGVSAKGGLHSVAGLATRTFDWGRLHLNHRSTFGGEAESAGAHDQSSRWTTGVAVDRALSLQGLLLVAETFVGRGLRDTASVQWNVGAGARYQWTERTTLDAGIAKAMSGGAGWSVSVGAGRTMAVRSLFPGAGAWGRR